MMHIPKIALPISQHFGAVYPELSDIVEMLIVRDIDRVPADISSYRKIRTYHTHGFINNQFKGEMTDSFLKLLNNYGVSHISFDCGPSCLDAHRSPERNDMFWPDYPGATLTPGEIIKVGRERLKFIRDRFRGTIALENLDYHAGGACEHVCEGSIISRIIKELGVWFAFDIGHFMVTAFNLGLDPIKYMYSLPLDLVYEVHISHAENGNDNHDCPTAYDYELLGRILERSRPEFVVLEYYEDSRKIIDENLRLYEFLNKKECPDEEKSRHQ